METELQVLMRLFNRIVHLTQDEEVRKDLLEFWANDHYFKSIEYDESSEYNDEGGYDRYVRVVEVKFRSELAMLEYIDTFIKPTDDANEYIEESGYVEEEMMIDFINYSEGVPPLELTQVINKHSLDTEPTFERIEGAEEELKAMLKSKLSKVIKVAKEIETKTTQLGIKLEESK